MRSTIPLKTGLGEVMAPGTLVTALVLTPDGTIRVDPGLLHGRSEIETHLQWVRQKDELANPHVVWLVWVAVELDSSNTPVRYKGIAASELWVDRERRLGYKVLAEHVNRMAEALRGGINLKTLGAQERVLIAQQLRSLGSEVWERTADNLKAALA